VLSFPFNVEALALISSFLTTLLTLPLWRKWCWRHGVVDDPGHRKIHDQPIPLAGGLAVLTGILAPAVIGIVVLLCLGHGAGLVSTMDMNRAREAGSAGLLDGRAIFLLKYGVSHRALRLAGLFLGTIGILVVGWLDDKHELRPGPKFLGQFLVALLVATTGTRITLFVHSILFSYAITILWILTLINAFNFMDNMNGLCAGLGVIGAWCFACVSASDGQYLVAMTAFLTAGALLGFIPWNFPRARAFLGDSGSHLVGYLLAILAILPHFYSTRHPRPVAVLIPLCVLAVPLVDMAWVVVLRTLHGKPFYEGDTNHLSHRLVRLGLTPSQSVLCIWTMAALAGSLVLLF
jgi:UDP-GlcNAc:undecaprenyl-phosphate GlcNAc-1-phosphate transferase